METWAAAKKDIYVRVLRSPGPVRIPSKWPPAPRVASVTSVANDNDDNEIIPGAMLRWHLPYICRNSEKKLS